MNFNWSLPTRVVFGAGCLDRLRDELAALGARRVLVVAGVSALAEAGALGRVRELCAGMELRVQAGVRPNLPMDDCDEVIAAVREFRPDAVVGIGGGSALDGAKAGALIGPQSGGARSWIDGQRGGAGAPYIAIPTTAGTGSEVTPFMIVFDAAAKRKLSLGRPEAFARVALVDPVLTLTLPPDQTAATGLDALSHALESYWSVNATPLSDALALDAIPYVLHLLVPAHRDPANLGARTWLSYAAMTAGMALAQTATAALHGITYPLTAHHRVPHGLACAFLMREIMAVNFHHLDPCKQKRLLRAFNARSLIAALDTLSLLFQELGVPDDFDGLKVADPDLDRFVAEASPQNLERNVAPLGPDRIMALWRAKEPGTDLEPR